MAKLNRTQIQAIFLLLTVPLGLAASTLLDSSMVGHASHLVETYVLPLFFIAVGLELRKEFQAGYFKDRSKIFAPLAGATMGVVVPALLFIAVAGPLAGAWSVPTATDITLGLAVLAFIATKLSSVIRARFLALATIDDVIGLLILLLVFSSKINWLALGLCLVALVAFHFSQKSRGPLLALSFLAAIATIAFGAESGFQTSIIGVVLGMTISNHKLYTWLEPTNGWAVLPMFGFLVSASAGSSLGAGLNIAVLAAVLIRPLGKFIGILVGGSVASKIAGGTLDFAAWSSIGILGGIGFTVSFLLAKISLEDSPSSYAAAIVGTLGATLISAILFLIFMGIKGRRARQA